MSVLHEVLIVGEHGSFRDTSALLGLLRYPSERLSSFLTVELRLFHGYFWKTFSKSSAAQEQDR